jgi:hypothetical protein
MREKMGAAARTLSLGRSWDRVFDGVYLAYGAFLETGSEPRRRPAPVHGEFLNHAAMGVWYSPRQCVCHR